MISAVLISGPHQHERIQQRAWDGLIQSGRIAVTVRTYYTKLTCPTMMKARNS